MKKLISSVTPFLISLTLLLGPTSQVFGGESQSPRSLPLIDIHAHFFQMAPEAVIRAMDDEAISMAVFMPVPNAGRSRRRGASEDFYLEAAKVFPARLAAFFGGNELNQELAGIDGSSVTDSGRERFRERVETILKQGGFKGIGELGPRHMAYVAGMREIEYPADHPLMLVLADLAAKYELPIDVHLEANEKTVAQFERLLARNGRARIIWSHAGWSNTGLATPGLIRKLMAKYLNLYSSIKYRKPESATQEAVKLMDEKGTLVLAWRSLFEEFPERFFIGTDVKLGDNETDYRHAAGHRRILEQLSEATARKIAWENASNLLGLKGFPYSKGQAAK